MVSVKNGFSAREKRGGLGFGRLMSLERIRRITLVYRLIKDVTMLLLISNQTTFLKHF